jgi:hypothetical protein
MASNVPSRRLALLGRSGVVPVLPREPGKSAAWIVRGATDSSPLARVVGVIAPSRR